MQRTAIDNIQILVFWAQPKVDKMLHERVKQDIFPSFTHSGLHLIQLIPSQLAWNIQTPSCEGPESHPFTQRALPKKRKTCDGTGKCSSSRSTLSFPPSNAATTKIQIQQSAQKGKNKQLRGWRPLRPEVCTKAVRTTGKLSRCTSSSEIKVHPIMIVNKQRCATRLQCLLRICVCEVAANRAGPKLASRGIIRMSHGNDTAQRQ